MCIKNVFQIIVFLKHLGMKLLKFRGVFYKQILKLRKQMQTLFYCLFYLYAITHLHYTM